MNLKSKLASYMHLMPGSAASAAVLARSHAARADETTTEDEENLDEEKSDDKDDKGNTGKKGKKARRAESDTDDPDAEDEETDKEKEAFTRGHTSAIARCKRIFQSDAAAARPDLAAFVAFDTTMRSAEAIGFLELAVAKPGAQATPAATSSSLASLMQENRIPALGSMPAASGPKPGSAEDLAASILAARDKVQGRS